MNQRIFGFLSNTSEIDSTIAQFSLLFKYQKRLVSACFFSYCSPCQPHTKDLVVETRHITCFFQGIITNKKNLHSALDLDQSGHCNDHELIFYSYKKWGIDLGQHLQGNYQLVLWDKEQKQMLCVNTPFLEQPLYYHSSKETFYFANNFSMLKRALGKLNLKADAIANHLLGNFIQQPHDRETTCYKNIFRLPPGHSLIVKDNKLNTKKISHDLSRSIQLDSREETVLAFRECFTKAVKDYLPQQGLIGSQLSGGLDSSSVSLIAAQLLKDSHQNLTCFGVAPDASLNFPTYKNWNLNDEALMQAVARQTDNINLQLIRCNKPAIKLTDLTKFCYQFCESPAANVMNMTWIASILYSASQQGIHTLLNGYVGNLTISFKGQHHTNTVLRNLAKLKHKLFAAKNTIFDSSLINPLALSKYRLHPPDPSVWYDLTIQQLFAVFKPEHSPSYDVSHALQLHFNVREIDPTTHPDVVSFCLNMPNDMYYHKGVSRCLIRESMRGILPEVIRLNTRRGTQCASWFYQLKEALPYYQALLPKFKKNDLIQEIIDLKQMEALMNELPSYDPFKHEAMQTYFKFNSKLIKALHVAEWIHLHDEPEPWEFNPVL